MKKLILLTLGACALLCVAQSQASAQCTSQSPISQSCSSRSCFGSYSQPPVCDGGGLNSCDAFATRCCGKLVIEYNGGGCTAAVLRNANTRAALDLAGSSGVEIAIVGCRHHLALYRPFPGGADPQELIDPRRESLFPTGF